ncbi:MAG: hypothetical protein IT453_22695 [Planctomycetes bacterium]|nr:hypothetical protein [Planctomycetota bacterium]
MSQETAADVLVRYRALAERVATGLGAAHASALVARATAEFAAAPAGEETRTLPSRFLRRVIDLAGSAGGASPGGTPLALGDAQPLDPAGAPASDATTLFGGDVFGRAHARWRALEALVVALPEAEFELFSARFQARARHAEIAERRGEPAQAVASRERALLEHLRRAREAGDRA